jgi:hypothetical protein
MKIEEQKAFVKAYSNNVASVPADRVEDFVKRYTTTENVEYSGDYTSIVDALGMWSDAIDWQIKNQPQSIAQKMFDRHSDVWAGVNTIHELFPVINMMQASLDSDAPMDKHQLKNVLDACKTILLYGGGLIEDWLFLAEEK